MLLIILYIMWVLFLSEFVEMKNNMKYQDLHILTVMKQCTLNSLTLRSRGVQSFFRNKNPEGFRQVSGFKFEGNKDNITWYDMHIANLKVQLQLQLQLKIKIALVSIDPATHSCKYISKPFLNIWMHNYIYLKWTFDERLYEHWYEQLQLYLLA